MQWKLTGRFLTAIISIVILVILANTIMLFILLFHQANKELQDIDTSYSEDNVRLLSRHMYIDEQGLPQLDETGIASITSQFSWVQFLNANGQVINDYFAPDFALKHYSAVDIIQIYKYHDYGIDTIIFVSEFDQFPYIVGVQNNAIQRITFTYNPSIAFKMISEYMLYIVIIDLAIACLVGLLFSSILTKPLNTIMKLIQQLKNRNYATSGIKRTGIYKQVFTNIEDVALELQLQEKDRKKLEEMRNEWISNVSHDMKTPLASIQGYAELLQDASSEESKQYSAIIEQKAIYMHELLNDFTLALRLKNNQLPLQQRELDLVVFLKELIIDVLNTPGFAARQIEFDATIPKAIKFIDEHLMKRAITNIIVNALVHNDDQVVVKIILFAVNEKVIITVEDNGKGMTKEDVDNVFERYYRGSYTENVLGTGLGTAIARDIVIAHQGDITLVSELGKGTSVRIIL